MQFALWLENEKFFAIHQKAKASNGYDSRQDLRQFSAILVLHIHGYSEGMHSFGDYEEEPAGDPFEEAKWDFPMQNPAVEKLLQGNLTIVYDGSWGSYHEAKADVYVYVLVPEEIKDQLDDLNQGYWSLVHHKFDIRRVKYTFPFVSVYDTAKRVEKQTAEFQPNPGEKSGAYWQRLIQQAMKDMNYKDPHDKYNARDNYWKK